MKQYKVWAGGAARRGRAGAVALALLGTGTVAAAPLHTGIWWDPAESGWGLMVTDQGSLMAPYWYAPDQDGEPTWFFAAAAPQADGSYSGTVMRFTGVPFAQITGQSADPAQEIGSATLRFSNGLLQLDYTLDGSSGSKQLQRLNVGGKDIACQAADEGAQTDTGNYSDLWFQPSAPGWGMQVTHLDQDLFISWYTYDADREAVYFNGTAQRTAAGRFEGTLYRTHDGTPFVQVDGAPAAAGADAVGSFRMEFTDGAHGTFRYTVGSVTQAWPVERIRFGSAAAVCSVVAWQASGSTGGNNSGGNNGLGDECMPPNRVGDLRRVRVTTTSNGATEVLEREERIVGESTFEGQPALVEEVSGQTTAGTGVYARTYYATDSGDSVVTYGAQSLHPGTGQLLATSVNVPLRVGQPRRFQVGQLWQAAWTVRATAQGTVSELDASASARYVGRETVTTAAGIFDSCKFETSHEVGGSVSGITTLSSETGVSWTHPDWGTVRSESSGESVVHSPFGSTTTTTGAVLELLSASRNGQSTP